MRRDKRGKTRLKRLHLLAFAIVAFVAYQYVGAFLFASRRRWSPADDAAAAAAAAAAVVPAQEPAPPSPSSSSTSATKPSSSSSSSTTNNETNKSDPTKSTRVVDKVLFFMITTQSYHETRGVASSATWVSKMPHTVWYTDAEDTSNSLQPPAVVVHHPKYDAAMAEDRKAGKTKGNKIKAKAFYAIAYKTLEVFRHVYEHYHLNPAAPRYEWYCRFWDDNYVIEEGIEWLLGKHAHEQHKPIMLGSGGWGDRAHKLRFLGGGSGWYMSRAAMDAFGPKIDECEAAIEAKTLSNGRMAKKNLAEEDVLISRCLEELSGVRLLPEFGLWSGGPPAKYRISDAELLDSVRHGTLLNKKRGLKPSIPVAFHYVPPKELYRMHELLFPTDATAD
jgi:hypothetical protein